MSRAQSMRAGGRWSRFSILLLSAFGLVGGWWAWRAAPLERTGSERSASVPAPRESPDDARRNATSPSKIGALAVAEPQRSVAPVTTAQTAQARLLTPLATDLPHPITSAHQRIFEENARIEALNGAVDQRDAAALRRMNEEYRQAYPEDEHVLQDGYELLAQCLEERTPQVLQAAQRFWHEQRASSLRRYVRRYCLSAQVP